MKRVVLAALLIPTLACPFFSTALRADDATGPTAQLGGMVNALSAVNQPAPLQHCDTNPKELERCGKLELVGYKDLDKTGQDTPLTLTAMLRQIHADPHSPYARFANYNFLSKGKPIQACFDRIGYRYSDGDRCSVEHLTDRLRFFDKDTAVLMSSGGAHSVAMAARLVKDGSHEAIWKMGSQFHPKSPVANEQDIASLKYQLSDFQAAKPAPGAPPVFIMDQHRSDPPVKGLDKFDNRGEFSLAEYPSPALFKAHGIKKIIWIVEGKTDAEPRLIDDTLYKSLADGTSGFYERYHRDPLAILKAYRKAGIEVYQQRISPYDCPYSKRHN